MVLSTSEKLASRNPAQRADGRRELSQQLTSSERKRTIARAKNIVRSGARGVTSVVTIGKETRPLVRATELFEVTFQGRTFTTPDPNFIPRGARQSQSPVTRRVVGRQSVQVLTQTQPGKKPVFLSKEFLEKKLERLGQLTKEEGRALERARIEQRKVIRFFPEDRAKATAAVAGRVVRVRVKKAVEAAAREVFGVLELGATLGKLQRGEIKIDVRKVPSLAKAAVLGTGEAFRTDPVSTAIEFYVFGRALGVLGRIIKGATKFKGSPTSQTLQQEALVKSVPKQVQSKIRGLLKSKEFQRAINPKKISILPKIDIVQARALTIPEIRGLSKTFKATDTVILDKVPKAKAPVIVTADINSFNRKFLSQLPKGIRRNYKIRGNSIIRQDGSILFRQTSLGRLIPSPSVDLFLRTSRGRRILKVQPRKTQPLAKSQLEEQRRLLRTQQRLQSKIKKGLQVKAPRLNFVLRNGKKVFPFLNEITGKVSFLTSRKQWFNLVKKQAKKTTTKKTIKAKTLLSRLQLEKQKRLLRTQQRLQSKLRKGLQIKAKRVDGIFYKEVSLSSTGQIVSKGTKGSRLLKNIKLFPFKVSPGRIRNFTSRKLWLKAIRKQGRAKAVTPLQVKREAVRLAKRKTKLSRVQLEKQKRALMTQKRLEAKLKRGLQVKAPRLDFIIRNGRKAFPFKDIITGKFRFFTSRKLWLRALKQQAKLTRPGKVNWDIWLKPTPQLEKVLANKVIPLVRKKPRITIFKRPAVRLKPGEREVRVGDQVLIQKLEKPLQKKIITVQRQSTQLKTKQKLKVAQKQSSRLRQELVVKVKQATRTKSRTRVRSLVAALAVVRKAHVKVAQKLKIATKQKQREIVRQKQRQKLKTKQKLRTQQKQKLTPKERQRLKTKQKQKLTESRFKRKLLKLEEKKRKELTTLTKRVLPKQSFIYIPDLYSRVFGIRAKPKERAAFLRAGRVFTGIESRPLIPARIIKRKR